MARGIRRTPSTTALLALCAAAAAAADWPALESGPLQDNSFFIEEAYNQEAGVVQHIATAKLDSKSRDWDAVFTQEWPLGGQTNQLSYTVPYTWAGETGAPSGVRDVLLNYRWQALYETDRRPAMAPRLSLVLPTGDEREELGTGSAGLESLLPVSKQLGPHWAAHANLGLRWVPNARRPGHEGEDLLSWTWGGSVIWEPVNAINFLAELVGARENDIVNRRVVWETLLLFSPGVRVGWNGPWGVQYVGGVAVPIGLTRDTDDLGVFFYLSVEHAFTAAARREREW